MAAYLETDGVDDRINFPSFNYTAFEADIMVLEREDWHQIVNLGGRQLNFNSNTLNVSHHADYQTVYVDGIAVANNTPSIPIGQRVLVRGELKAGVNTGTSASFLFHNSVTQFLRGRMYSFRMYQGATLGASYDAATGGLQDQSGNGRHGTLVGGTWGDDSPGGPLELTASGSASSKSAASGSAIKQARATGVSTSASSTTGSARKTTGASGGSISKSKATAVARKDTSVTGAAYSKSIAQGDGVVGGATTVINAAGHATSRSSVSSTARKHTEASGAALSFSNATADVRRVLLAFGLAISVSKVAGAASKRTSGNGTSQSRSLAQGGAMFIDVSMPLYKRTFFIGVHLTRKKSYKVGIVRRERYDIKW